MSLLEQIGYFIQREFKLYRVNPYPLLTPLLFFSLVLFLASMTSNADFELHQGLVPILLWLTWMLAMLLTYDLPFGEDAQDGCLEAYLLSPFSLTLIVYCKILVHWLVITLPFFLLLPLFTLFLQLPIQSLSPLYITFALCTPILSLLGLLINSLLLQVKQGNMLQPILVLPLFIPCLLFSTSVMTQALDGYPIHPELFFLGGLLVLSLTLIPYCINVALKWCME